MGASYSYNVNPNSSSSSSIQSSNSIDQQDIFVLFVDNNAVCYSFKFNTMFEKAVEIKNNVCCNIMTNHGNSFTVSTEEKTDNSSFYNVTILTRETNCLTSIDSIHHTLSIQKLKHLDDQVEVKLNNDNLTNKLYNEEEDKDDEEPQGYKEHKEENEDNEEDEDEEPAKNE